MRENLSTKTDIYAMSGLRHSSSSEHTGHRFGFNGMEKDDQVFNVSGSSYTAEFWQYDSRLGRRWNIDPIVKIDQSPYSTFTNNPIWLIDPAGADTAKFNADRSFSHSVAAEGTHVGQLLGDDGFMFDFADPVNDYQDIVDGNITELYITSDSEMLKDLDRSGATDDENQGMVAGALYLWNNSHAGSNSGKTDFTIKSEIHGFHMLGEEKIAGLHSNKLYITKVDDKMLGHNSSNFGNFMWGASARALDVGIMAALAGAHVNNYLTDSGNYYKKWYQKELDSRDDQFSITAGYLWYHNFLKAKK